MTRCDLSGLLDFLEGALGFSPGIVCGLASLGEFGLLILYTLFQGLTLLYGFLELLLNLDDPGLVIFTSGLLLGRLLLGLGYRLLKILNFGRRSYYISRHFFSQNNYSLVFTYKQSYPIPWLSSNCFFTWPSSFSACSSL